MNLTITFTREGYDRADGDRTHHRLRRRVLPAIDNHHDDHGPDDFHDSDDGRTHYYGDGCDDDHGRADHDAAATPTTAALDDDKLHQLVDDLIEHGPDEHDYGPQFDEHDDGRYDDPFDDYEHPTDDDDVPRLRALDDDDNPPNRDAATPSDPLTGDDHDPHR